MVQINPNFIKHIQQELPAHLDFDEFIDYCQRPLRKSIRVNTLKISSNAFIEMMTPKGWQFEPIPWCEAGFWVTLEDNVQIGNLVEHIQGLFYIQEASSMLPPTALFHQNSSTQSVLDVASAPGSKTTQLAALMQNTGLLVANEYSSSRVKMLHANTVRMGVSNVALSHFDGKVFGEYLYETFDSVLLDAPCGGEGTVRKDPLALKDWDFDDVQAIADTQKTLIESAFLALKPGGSLVYSTCTLSQLENQAICEYLLQQYPDAVQFESLATLFPGAEKATTKEGFLHVWPQIFDSEGFFVAKITKLCSVPRLKKEPKKQRSFPFSECNSKTILRLQQYFQTNFNIHIDSNAAIYQRDEELWLFPAEFIPLIGKMRYQRIGLKLADILKKGFKAKHEAVTALTTSCMTMADNNRSIELSREQAKAYLMGRDIDINSFDEASLEQIGHQAQGEMLVTYHQQVLGIVKHLGHRLKNNLPRDLVRDKIEV